MDKIDFISKVNTNAILDFGCADGYILNAIRMKYPKIRGLVGYDLDEQMVEIAKRKNPKIKATTDWNKAFKYITRFQRPSITLMSVIHEVYSYSKTPNDIKEFWNRVFNNKFKYVIIRDMMPAKAHGNIPVSPDDIEMVQSKMRGHKKYAKSFEKQWDNIFKSYRNLAHWLLKYSYKKNWAREVKENYMPINLETLKAKIPAGWKIIYQEHYIYKPVADKIKRDFGIDLKYPTHIKMIIENKRK
jgi:hypothetical protein